MQQGPRWPRAFLTCLTALLLSSAATAQDQDRKPEAKTRERSSLDEAIHQNLRGIIDHGATLYNSGDWNGCYRLWEGALMAVRPMLGERRLRAWAKPVEKDAASAAILQEIQKELQTQLGDRPLLKDVIEKGLDNARQTPQLFRRAFVLRVVLDQLRAESGTASSPDSKRNTLWERLGGEEGVTRIVDDFVNLAAKDPKVDFFRHNKVKLEAEHIVKMKRELVEQISQASGGPLKYSGPDMKKVHRDMGITNEQLDAAVADLKKALEKNKVAAEDQKKILDALESYRQEIVQPKKPEEKKPVEKTPEDRKPADKAIMSGKVIYLGAPVTGGTIELVGKDHKYKGTIEANGDFNLTDVKAGEYKIGISTKGAKMPVRIPAAYSDPDKSGLAVTVKNGQQRLDLLLK
jgi:hemoglobin